MPAFVQSPRRAPRYQVKLEAAVAWGSAAWSGTTQDLSLTGCAVVSDRPVARGMRVALMLRRAGLAAPLSMEGDVAWSRGNRFAVRFARPLSRVTPETWLDALLRLDPALAGRARRLPARLPLDALVEVQAGGLVGQVLDLDEARVVRAATAGGSLGLTALRSRLSPERFARAAYALVGKGVLTSPAFERSRADALRSLDQLAAALLHPGAPQPAAGPPPAAPGETRRSAMRDVRVAAELALGLKHR